MKSLLGLAVITLALAQTAAAHVQLDAPQRRYDDMKGGACGRGEGTDGRTSRFSRFAPGETITVRWTETIDHTGSFVVSFDEDGADEADFAANILHEEADPAGTGGEQREAQVTLPDVECTNCTLRLVQIMSTSENPSPSSIYYQCADIVLGDGDSAGAEVEGCAAAAPASMAPLALALLALGRRRRQVQPRRQG
jgi:uncharacterized protein (TIGR03382 family)